MSAVSLDHVTIGLGGRKILADISLTIDQGEFIGLLGPNGAGKTSLMRAILGLIRPSHGTIRVLGRPARRGNSAIGYVPQMHRAAAGLRLSGWNFVASAVDGHRWGLPWSGAELRSEVDWALDAVGAGDLARRALADISGGERQRLLLAQSLLGRPRILLLDEPLISLDPHHQQQVLELVRRLQRELEITVLFSAHEINPLLGVIDRVLYLGHGQAALGEVEDVITGPVLSRLYGSEIEVIRLAGRIFVMANGHDLERARGIVTMLTYDFMRNAFAASGIVAVVAGTVGFFLVLRGQTFAGHALSHVGFAGATGAILIGIPALWGMVGFTVAAGLAMGMLGERLSGRDVAIGIVLSLSMGLGLLFLHYYTSYATQVTNLLFGNVLGVSRDTLRSLLLLGLVSLAGLAAIARPLLFASLQPDVAEARGVSLQLVSLLFLGIVALTVAASTQIVGVLLVFSLMVGPAATAMRLTSRLGIGVALAAALALAEAWAGVTLAYYSDWPVSFCITAFSAAGYFLTLLRR